MISSVLQCEKIKNFENVKKSMYIQANPKLSFSLINTKEVSDIDSIINNFKSIFTQNTELVIAINSNQTINETICYMLYHLLNKDELILGKVKIDELFEVIIDKVDSIFRFLHNEYNYKLFELFLKYSQLVNNLQSSIFYRDTRLSELIRVKFIGTNFLENLENLQFIKFKKLFNKIVQLTISLHIILYFDSFLQKILEMKKNNLKLSEFLPHC